MKPRQIIFDIKQRLLPTLQGDEAQRLLYDAVLGGVSPSW